MCNFNPLKPHNTDQLLSGSIPPAELLSQVIGIAREAGNSIMTIYGDQKNEVTAKADHSPLTLADLAADRVIKAGLARSGMGWPVLSEESAQIDYSTRQSWQRFWLVDPLDGTKEFIRHNGEFTVNIALIEHGRPILGVVYAPVLDVCYFAARGRGAFVKRATQAPQPIRVQTCLPGEPIKVVASRSHADERTSRLLHYLGEHHCISMGSSLKLCLVAEGAAHFYPRLGPTMEWDTAAAHAIVEEAGGVVQDQNGMGLKYNKEDLHNPAFFVFAQTDEESATRINRAIEQSC